MVNEERMKIINDILAGSSSRLNEGYFKKHFNSIYVEIMKHIKDNPLITFYTKHIKEGSKERPKTHFPQMLWYWVNEEIKRPMCKTCGKNPTMFDGKWSEPYRDYCSHQCSAKNNTTKIKREETNLKLYNVDNVAKLQSVKDKQEETNLKKYGFKSTFQSPEVRKLWSENYEKNHGYIHCFQDPKVKAKIAIRQEEYSMRKFGTKNVMISDEWRKEVKLIQNITTFNRFKNIYSDEYDFFNYENYIFNIKHLECGNSFEINIDRMNLRHNSKNPICLHCFPISENDSICEKEMMNWVLSLGLEAYKDKKILNGKELDIYIPSHNIAIEHNGVYYHSDLFTPNDYHLNKTTVCEENGIQLLHIWSDEWKYKKNIVKSIIKNQLGLIENKIYARKCEIREISDSYIVQEFLYGNHILGKTKNLTIKIGLYYNNELVSLMCFKNKDNDIELVRFCNKIDTNVIGGANKLFKHFINNYDFNKIISFSDYRLFDGKLYEILGFNNIGLNKPDFYWTKDDIRYPKRTFRKNKIKKEPFYDESKTLVEMMKSQKYNRIYHCGLVKWEYKKGDS